MTPETRTTSIFLLTALEGPREREILTEPARAFLAALSDNFETRRQELLARRAGRKI